MFSPNMVVDGVTWRGVTRPGTGEQISIMNFCIFNIYVYCI